MIIGWRGEWRRAEVEYLEVNIVGVMDGCEDLNTGRY